MKRTHLMVGATLSALSTMAMASAPDTEAVEFYNALNKHYFITATASEARIIDSGGAGEGWMRTGRSFQAWLKKADAPATAQPVCRFYSSGANSHFYTASGAECEGLKAARSGWQYEGIAFYIQAPVKGQCPADTVELLRIYNNGFSNGEGSNHRFVDDASLKELMVESHWIAEGTVFCAAPKSTGTSANLPGTRRRSLSSSRSPPTAPSRERETAARSRAGWTPATAFARSSSGPRRRAAAPMRPSTANIAASSCSASASAR
jgi:hypothetical protein